MQQTFAALFYFTILMEVRKRNKRWKNVEDLSQIALRQRVLNDMSALSLETTLFNETLSMPVALAPVL